MTEQHTPQAQIDDFLNEVSRLHHTKFEEGQTVCIKVKNVGYDVKVNGKVQKAPFKKFKRKDGTAIDLNVIRQTVWWQIVLSPDVEEAHRIGDYWHNELDFWAFFPELKCQEYYYVRGEYKLKEVGDSGRLRPEIHIWEPDGIIKAPTLERPPRPSDVAKIKARNKANLKKTQKRITKNKAKTGKATPRKTKAA